VSGTRTLPVESESESTLTPPSEIDKFGFGKYQICIWFLCGFGYFLDLAWAQGVGLGATAI
jgi:hypothetical protein